MPTNAYLQASLISGYVPYVYSALSNTKTLNAAATWTAYSFVAQDTQLTAVKVYISAIVPSPGSLATTDITVQVYSDTGVGLPNVAIGTAGNAAVTPVVGWNTLSGMTNSLTVGTQYYIVIQNTNSSPTVNYPSLQPQGIMPETFSYSSLLGPRNLNTTNSGTSWTGITAACGNWRGFNSTSGIYFGFPTTLPQTMGSGERVQGTVEYGAKFTTISGASQNINRVGFHLLRQGTTGNVGAKIYNASNTLIATSTKILTGLISTVSIYPTEFYFSSPVTLSPNTVYYATVFEDGSSTGSNYIQTYKTPFDNATNSVPLMPFNGTMQAYVNNNGTFSASLDSTATYNCIIPFWLGFTPGNELTTSSSGPQYRIWGGY